MTRRVLLDANMLIGIFDGDGKNEKHIEAQREFETLAADPEVEFVVTPLVRYEFLRGVRRLGPVETSEACLEMTAALNGFGQFDIRQNVGDRAAELFRLAKERGVDLNKHSFDLLHCASADVNGFEIASQDGDIPKIQQLIQDSRKNA